jgi:dihydroflavonol-4-reductase
MTSVRSGQHPGRGEVVTRPVTVCVTGATGFVGAHVARCLAERGERVRVTYRNKSRLERLSAFDVEPVKADVTDRAGMRRALRGCDLLYHSAGYVGARPPQRVWDVNALSPRVAVEAAAAEDVPRVVLTSSVAGIGPVSRGEVGDEEEVYRGGGLGMTYADAKHEGEAEALAAGARESVEVVIVNPSYVFGPPVDRSQPGETSTRAIGNYLLGRLPAVVDGQINAVDVRDVATGHLQAAEKGRPGERYVLGGHDVNWVELFERVADLSGARHPLVVLPTGVAELARVAEVVRLPMPLAPEGFVLMAQNWRYSSRKARRELGYRARSLDKTLRDTIDWYRELIEAGAFNGGGSSSLSLAAAGLNLADRVGALRGVRAAERYLGVKLLAGH